MSSSHSSRSHLPAHFKPADLPLEISFGGQRTTLRRLEPADASRLLEFFESHTEETKEARYGCAGTQITLERAAQLVGVDQDRDAALGVFETVDPKHPLIAIGRYCLSARGRSAEVAFVVHEARRRLGIGTTLCAALIAIARERNLDHLVAEVRQGNVPMIHVLRATGAAFEWISGAPGFKATLLLPGTTAGTRAVHQVHGSPPSRLPAAERTPHPSRIAPN